VTAAGFLIGGLAFRGSTHNEFQLESTGRPESAAGEEPAAAGATLWAPAFSDPAGLSPWPRRLCPPPSV